MNRLLPYAVKDTPEAILGVVGQSLIERHLLDAVLSAANAQMPMDDGIRRRLAHRPRLIAELLAADFLSAADRDAMITTSTAALNVVAHDLTLLPIWQDLILGDPETAEQLFYLCRMQSEPLAVIGEEEILDAVSACPGRLLRLTAQINDTAFKELDEEVLRELPSRRLSSPEWALEWLARNLVSDEEPLDADLVKALSESEECAYLAMRILRNRVHRAEIWAPLEPAIKSPRWAYHALRDELLVRDDARCESILIRHPGWLVEWMTDAEPDRESIRLMYLQSSRAAHDHEMIGDLFHWFRTQSYLRLVRRAVPAEA